MLTKLFIVEPVACYTFESECATGQNKTCPSATEASAGGFEANGQLLAAFSALVTKLVAALPTVLPEIQAVIALFGKPPAPAAS
jgi:hypothetical protein